MFSQSSLVGPEVEETMVPPPRAPGCPSPAVYAGQAPPSLLAIETPSMSGRRAHPCLHVGFCTP